MRTAIDVNGGCTPDESTAREEQVFAFDMPHELTAGEAAKLIDEQPPEGFYPWQMVPWPGVGVRVFCKRSKASTPAELAERRRQTADAVRRGKDLEDEQAHAAVARILSGRPHISVGAARVQLVALGFRRGTDFVKESMQRTKAKR